MELILKGAIISGSLIMAIGGQNAFVLKQGLLRENIFVVVLTCFLCDVALMTVGVLGLGSIISKNEWLSWLLAASGSLFLFWYGYRSFYSALKSSNALNEATSSSEEKGIGRAILITLSITLLNPHVYLDTVVVVGGVAGTMPLDHKLQFLVGALLASFVWFFGLGYGSRALLPIFKNPRAWRILEFLIGCTMWWIAFELARYVIASLPS